MSCDLTDIWVCSFHHSFEKCMSRAHYEPETLLGTGWLYNVEQNRHGLCPQRSHKLIGDADIKPITSNHTDKQEM